MKTTDPVNMCWRIIIHVSKQYSTYQYLQSRR